MGREFKNMQLKLISNAIILNQSNKDSLILLLQIIIDQFEKKLIQLLEEKIDFNKLIGEIEKNVSFEEFNAQNSNGFYLKNRHTAERKTYNELTLRMCSQVFKKLREKIQLQQRHNERMKTFLKDFFLKEKRY